MESAYISSDNAISRYFKTMEREGYKIKVLEDSVLFKKDNTLSVISFSSNQELERNIRLFRRGLPQPND